MFRVVSRPLWPVPLLRRSAGPSRARRAGKELARAGPEMRLGKQGGPHGNSAHPCTCPLPHRLSRPGPLRRSPPSSPAHPKRHPNLSPPLRAPGECTGPDEAAAYPICSHDPFCLQRGHRWHHLPSIREAPPSQLPGNDPVHMGLAARRLRASATPAPRGSSKVPVATLVSQQRSPAAAHAAEGLASPGSSRVVFRCQTKASISRTPRSGWGFLLLRA
jgi:hypothetical protein